MSLKRNVVRKVNSKIFTKKKRILVHALKAKPAKVIVKKEIKKEVKKEPTVKFKKLSKEDLILNYRANARKLSRSILRRWRSRIELEELDSLVDLALCEAAERYDPKKGASFMTFMYYHLRGCLVRAVDTAANSNLVSAADFELEDLTSGFNPTREQTESGMSAVADMADSINNEDYLLPDEHLYKKEVANISSGACSKLDELEQEVIFRLYVQEEQLVDIAKSLGYSRCHISRVKKRALDVLHESLSPVLGLKGKPNYDDGEEISRNRNLRKVITRRKFTKDEEVSLPIATMEIPTFEQAAA
ncbi:MAG: sigma-70 family RNA polymerase sigma factor [bacterium]|nr:sigma-70 family RNA polymerase sigma factor [bacterium]